MRTTNNDIKNYINGIIRANTVNWTYRRGENFGIRLQVEVGNYYRDNAVRLNIRNVQINTNPNDVHADVVITYNDNTEEGCEVKSCKDGALPGVTICNAPHLLNDKKAFLINYTIGADGIISVVDVYETEIFRLTSINTRGKYRGCLISTRDTGKKIKGRNFNEFISTSPDDDYTLEELTAPELIRKTILYYSASKLVDPEYNFTDEEILEAIHNLKGND